MSKGRKRTGDADIKINIRMGKELYENLVKLTEFANKKENTNLSEVVRKALEAFVEKNRKLL